MAGWRAGKLCDCELKVPLDSPIFAESPTYGGGGPRPTGRMTVQWASAPNPHRPFGRRFATAIFMAEVKSVI